jgi:hypothetical protein
VEFNSTSDSIWVDLALRTLVVLVCNIDVVIVVVLTWWGVDADLTCKL